MSTLRDIEAAADVLPLEQKQELLLFLAIRLRAEGATTTRADASGFNDHNNRDPHEGGDTNEDMAQAEACTPNAC